MEQRFVICSIGLGGEFANIDAQEKRSDVISKCISMEPKHGEVWQSVAKDPANAHKSTEDILKIVANIIS